MNVAFPERALCYRLYDPVHIQNPGILIKRTLIIQPLPVKACYVILNASTVYIDYYHGVTRPCRGQFTLNGGAVTSSSIKTAGDSMTEAIVRHVRNKYSIQIGEREAEKAKITIGSVWRREDVQSTEITGKSLKSGVPLITELNSYDMTEALEEPMTRIIEEICSVIERTPPELVTDVADNGIILTGGGSQIYGLDKIISSVTGLPVKCAEQPSLCVVLGAAKADTAGLYSDRPRRRINVK